MLDDVKILLDIEGSDLDAKLTIIQSSVEARLRVLLGGVEEIPAALEYIVDEVTVIRFNRIGSEGMTSHGVEGESISYNDNDFAGYLDDIDTWLAQQADAKRGRVRFL